MHAGPSQLEQQPASNCNCNGNGDSSRWSGLYDASESRRPVRQRDATDATVRRGDQPGPVTPFGATSTCDA